MHRKISVFVLMDSFLLSDLIDHVSLGADFNQNCEVSLVFFHVHDSENCNFWFLLLYSDVRGRIENV